MWSADQQNLRFSPSDLINHLECGHLTWLDRECALGRIDPPGERDELAVLLGRKGEEHETAHLESLRAAGRTVFDASESAPDPEARARTTIEAMRRGVDVVYQATFVRENWLAYADFLERVETPSPELGDWSYEVVDTKLARRAKPYFLIQLCAYSEMLAAVQGREPQSMHVQLGTGARESFSYPAYAAYFRQLRARFHDLLGAEHEPYPLPVEHCGVCRWAERCRRRWQDDDHLTLVADIRRDQVARLEAGGIATLAALAALPEDARVRRMAPATLEKLRRQARLQFAQRGDGEPRYELLPRESGRGFERLPEPDPGDVFFDIEGDPYWEGGLEYLFGAAYQDNGAWIYRPWWAHDRVEERAATESFIDFIEERRRRYPGLHVYHYAHYEPTALKRLAAGYGTREAELDDWLRHGVLVDLYAVVRQGLRASLPGYSIKDLEAFYAESREGEVTGGGDSILAYERWLDERDAKLIEELARYNEADCRSTRQLRDWLLERAAEARERLPAPPPPPEPRVQEITPEQIEIEEEIAALTAALTGDAPFEPEARTAEQHGRVLLAHLLEYHRREARPFWWAFFDRLSKTPEELVDDPESLGDLAPDPEVPPRPHKRSQIHTLRFPPQETKLGPGTTVTDPATGDSAGEIHGLDTARGVLELRRGPKFANIPLPRAIFAGTHYPTKEHRAALRRVAAVATRVGLDGAGPFRAARALLRTDPPRLTGLDSGAPLHETEVDLELAWTRLTQLDSSHLFIQGPPGSGKTWLGARLIVRLLRAGKRVGVTSNSHHAIHNLLREIEEVAHDERLDFRGIKKCGEEDYTRFTSARTGAFIANSSDNADCASTAYGLVAGTSWLFCREEMESSVDYLFVDEAGQIALANAVAMGTAAENLVFLGDPQQLAQVSLGVHPEDSGNSVLEHLLGGHQTVPPERGLFLSQSWRMHPDVCRFVSEIAYEGRLHAAPGRERQLVRGGALAGTGLRFLPVEHAGNSQRSEEEAHVVAGAIEALRGSRFVDHEGVERDLELGHILVVAPYNAQVRCLAEHLPEGARVGTVDKFQGQQAPVVIFSMATSSGEDLPRDLEFLFSRNRLNVAVSRAKCLAALVASPELLSVRCHTVEQMQLVNALCRFVELAELVNST